MSEETREEQVIRSSDFIEQEAMNLLGNCSSMEAKARFLQAAQMCNLTKAILVAAESIRGGLIWVSDSLDKVAAANKTTEEDAEAEAKDDSEDGDEEDEDPDPEGPVRLIPTTPQIRKRYIRTVDGLQLEKAE